MEKNRREGVCSTDVVITLPGMNTAPRALVLVLSVLILAGAVVLAPLWRPLCAGLVLGYFSEDAVAALSRRLRVGAHGRLLVAAGFITSVLLLFLLPVGFAIYQALHELLSSFDTEKLTGGGTIDPLSQLTHTINTWLAARLSAWGLTLSASMVSALGDRLREAALPLLQSALGALRSSCSVAAASAAITWGRAQVLPHVCLRGPEIT